MVIKNFRLHVALKTHATIRYLLQVQAAVEDIFGCLENGQKLVSMFQLRIAILKCLSIKNIVEGGNPVEIHEIDQIDYDPLDKLLDSDLELAAEQMKLFVIAFEKNEIEVWKQQFIHFIFTYEKMLGFDKQLPSVRSPEGFQFLLNICKNWEPLLINLDLPTALPSEWISAAQQK